MAEEEELDIELNDAADKDHEVEEINLDDVKDAGLDDFLKEVDSKEDLPDINYQDEVAHTSYSDDVAALSEATEADFANLNLNDFNAALDSYKAARSGKVSTASVATDDVAQIDVPTDNGVAAEDEDPITYEQEREFTVEADNTDKKEESEVSASAAENEESKEAVEELPIEEESFDDLPVIKNKDDAGQEIMNWYSGSLKDKTYKISDNDMPEFLDGDRTTRVIHVSVESPYGWNVFFDNGMFMSLRDVKEYQERHGELPCQEGKIIYGDKTCSFEQILKIVVYEQPRYFSYQVKQ